MSEDRYPYGLVKGGAEFKASRDEADSRLKNAINSQQATAALSGAEGAPEPQHERDMTQALQERDRYQDAADELAARIATITGEDIGEHSNLNDPWAQAINAADEFIAAQERPVAPAEQKADPIPIAGVLEKRNGALTFHPWRELEDNAEFMLVRYADARLALDAPTQPQAAEQSELIQVTRQDGNNYSRILTLLGMEEEGDPVAEVERLLASTPTSAAPEVVGYVRRHPGGKLTDEYIPAWRIEDVRKNSEAWVALSVGATSAAAGGCTTVGHALAMRVLQSELYRQLDDTERADCDELIARHIKLLKAPHLPPSVGTKLYTAPQEASASSSAEESFDPRADCEKSRRECEDPEICGSSGFCMGA